MTRTLGKKMERGAENGWLHLHFLRTAQRSGGSQTRDPCRFCQREAKRPTMVAPPCLRSRRSPPARTHASWGSHGIPRFLFVLTELSCKWKNGLSKVGMSKSQSCRSHSGSRRIVGVLIPGFWPRDRLFRRKRMPGEFLAVANNSGSLACPEPKVEAFDFLFVVFVEWRLEAKYLGLAVVPFLTPFLVGRVPLLR